MLTTLALAHTAHAHGPWVGGFGLFLLIPLFWIVVVVLIVALGRRRWRRAGWGPGAGYGRPMHGFAAVRSAEVSLAERFAQGDIDEVEYRARLEVLRANAYPTPPQR